MSGTLSFSFVSNVELVFEPWEHGRGWSDLEMRNADGQIAWAIWEVDPQGKGQDQFITMSLYETKNGKVQFTTVTQEQHDSFRGRKLYARPMLATLKT